MTQAFQLATASYRSFRSEWGLPVQISNGKPKYRLAYPLAYFLPDLYPAWRLMRAKDMPMEEFTAQYQADMDKIGVEKMTEGFAYLAKRSKESRLVLLCFEARPENCHRGSFADWWESRTGQEVPEMGAKPKPAYEQLAFDF